MNGDITRSTFRPERHFSGVRSQQGRVQLDADWNEQADIAVHRDRAGTEDVIGACGGPWTGDGFEVGMMAVPRRLDAVAFPVAGQGYLVGDHATILASGDSGATWLRRQGPAGTTVALRGVAFPAAGQGFAVGDKATIVATGDGGATWTRQQAPAGVTATLRAVAFPTASRGYVVGDDGMILTTGDGGATWTRQQAPAQVIGALRGVAFRTAGQGVAVGDDTTILATGDGGATWTRQQPPAGVTGALRAVALPAADRGFVVGDGTTILATADDGATWTLRAAPQELGVSAGHLYVGGVLCENERPVAVAGQPDLPGAAPPGSGTYLFYLDVWQRHLTAVERPELREVALGGPDTTTRTKTIWQVRWEEAGGKDCADFSGGWVPAGAASSGRLAARAVPSASVSDPCLVPPGAGYRRLENQCYRVEIHKPGAAGTATFKWSRDNGSVVSRVEKVDATAATVTITDPGKDAEVGFASAEFVELRDERQTLAGLRGTIVEVETLEGNDLVLPTTLPALGAGAVARRWESAEIPVTAGTWESLESGVQVRFTDGDYQTGDYWLIPARTLTGTVDWPVQDGEPVFEGRQGIAHDYCPIGILTVQGGVWALDHDCRPRTPFLTALTTLHDVGGQGQESLPGDPLPQLLQVASPVPGASVRFATKDGGVVAGTKADLPTSTASELTVEVDEHQIASCAWRLKPDPNTPSQLLQATLLDNAEEPIGRPVRFTANLSLASQVAYGVPAGCATLAGADTVQEAIDALAQQVRISYTGGDGQVSLPGQPLPQLLQVAAASPCGPATAKVRFTTANGRLARTAAELPTATNSVDVDTVNGIAGCAWILAPDPNTPSQQTEARLLDGGGNPVGLPVRFTANLSVASLVAYDPSACPGLAGVQTVKEAIDRLCTGTGQDPGIHVKEVILTATGAALRNDTLVTLNALERGIQVVCDHPIDPRCFPDKPTFTVTVDRPFPLTDADRQFWQTQELVGFEPLDLAGDAQLTEGNVIGWVPRTPAFNFLAVLLANMQQAGFGRQLQAHLTLQGNFVWGLDAQDLYLDGDTFGEPAGTAGATVGIRFPSGDGRRGGDLRMWFRISPTPGVRASGRRRSTSTSKRTRQP
jgi:photosystem II stability/assembly factor-like uncharacterized protein